MGVLTRLATWWLERSGTIDDWFREFGTGHKSASGISVTQARAMQAATVLACVSIRSIDLAKLPIHVYRRKSGGGQEIIQDHPLERLLRRPNPLQTRLEFFEQLQMYSLLRNNAHAAMVRNGRGAVEKIIPVNPDHVSIWDTPDGSLFYNVARRGQWEQAQLRTLPQLIPAEDMIHLRTLSMDSLSGLSRISLLKESIGLSLAQEETAARLFGNGARPSGFLKTDKRLSDKTWERVKAQLKAKYQGLENVGEIPVLEEGLDWTAGTMSFVDAELIKGREFQVAEIARAFDVPPHRLGIAPQGGGSGILQANQSYLNNTVSSDAERWEQKLNETFDLDGEREYAEFNLDYFNRADLQTRLTAYRTGVIGMIYTPNEARAAEGLPPIANGDTLYQPTNVAPIGFMPAGSETGPGSDITGDPAPGGDGDPAAVPDKANGHLNGGLHA